jgi:leucyl-tRNA synthetase
LGRVWRLFIDEKSETDFEQNVTTQPDRESLFVEDLQLSRAIQNSEPSGAQLKVLHACIKKVTEDLDGLRFNTAISALMVFVNEATSWTARPASILREFLILLQPFAPHLAEELWVKLNARNDANYSTAGYAPWPAFDPALLVEDTLEIPVQVNGKLRDVIKVSVDASPADLESAAMTSEKVKPFIQGKAIKKVIVLKGKLVNIVAV